MLAVKLQASIATNYLRVKGGSTQVLEQVAMLSNTLYVTPSNLSHVGKFIATHRPVVELKVQPLIVCKHESLVGTTALHISAIIYT